MILVLQSFSAMFFPINPNWLKFCDVDFDCFMFIVVVTSKIYCVWLRQVTCTCFEKTKQLSNAIVLFTTETTLCRWREKYIL